MYVNDTGLPSVTEVISPYIDASWFTDESRERGEAVHCAAAAHLQGLFVPSLDTAHRPYFESFKKWADEMIVEVVMIEERLIDKKLRYTGKPDIVCKIKGDGFLTLADLKTGQAEEKWWAIQNAAYRKLAMVDRIIHTVSGMSVRLKDDGTGALCKRYETGSYQAHFNIFLGLLNSFHFFNGR